MADLKLHVEGAEAAATAEALEQFFAEHFGQSPRREPVLPQTDEVRKADPVAVAALILAIPSAVLAVMDLADRIRFKHKVALLIALAKRQWAEHGTRIWLRRPDAGPVALDQAEPGEVLDAAAAEQEQDSPDSGRR